MQTKCPIAVVGVSALFPGATDVTGFWHNIIAGTDQIREIPESYWLIDDFYDADARATDKTYGRRGAFIDPVDFDCLTHGILPSQVQDTDTVQLMGLIVAQNVLRDAARGEFAHLDRSRMSVILGCAGGTEQLVQMGSRLQRPVWLKSLREAGVEESRAQAICDDIADHYVPWSEASFPGLLGNVVAGRIANRFNLGGTNCVVDAACASSSSAIAMAVQELYLGDSDAVLAGGADALNDILMYMCFSKTPALSASGDCRPFSDQADGTILGEGVGMVALRRLEDAERDGDTIYAVIKGVGSSSDGSGTAVYAPVSAGQSKAISRAYQSADFEPDTIELIEAHGTGTKAGDKAEFNGLKIAFEGAQREDQQWCAVGSVKSQIGHTKGAAGSASLIKTVLALHHKVLPPTIKVEQPNPLFDIEESPFYINTEARPWIRDQQYPRRAGVSSFGFGGSNFHIALEEYLGAQEQPRRILDTARQLLLWSADQPGALFEAVETSLADLPNDDEALEYLARRSQLDFDASQSHRLAFVVASVDELRQQLGNSRSTIEADPHRNHSSPKGWHYGQGKHAGKVALLFPGQGSQYLNMGNQLAMTFPAARRVWDEAASLALDDERALHQLVFPRPVFNDEDRKQQARELSATEWAQPAIGATSLSQWALLQPMGLQVDGVGGHSFGELTALHVAGAFDRTTLLGMARRRGELMAAAATQQAGAMSAVAADRDTVQAILDAIEAETNANGSVRIANVNSPRQVVISGESDAVERAEQACREHKLSVTRLPVATAFHSPVVADALAPFAEYLQGVPFSRLKLPVYANKTAQPYARTSKAQKTCLAQQLAEPVLFMDQILAMRADGFTTFIEVGPGNVLSKLVDASLTDGDHLSVALDRKGRAGLDCLWNALAQLSSAGLALDFSPLWEGFREYQNPAERPVPKMPLPISGINYNRAYPPAGGAAALPKPNLTDTTIPEQPLVSAAPAAAAPAAPLSAPTTPVVAPVAAPAAAVVAPTATAASTDPGASWLAAFEMIQRQTNESHRQFLQMSERSLDQLGNLLHGQSPLPTTAPAVSAAQPPPIMAAPATPDVASVQATAPVVPPPAPAAVAPETVAPSPAPVPTSISPAPQTASTVAAAPPADVNETMLQIVRAKTGYPREMLTLDMDLEHDLGIDSIKRVEILSATIDELPDLPEVNPGDMASLRTLQEVTDFMASRLPATSGAAATDSAAPGIDTEQLLLAIVAEKTGYPEEMLSPEMDLENDLGVDSIKRVEILSAAIEQVPDLPPLEPSAMADLRTLGDVAGYIAAQLGANTAPARSGAAQPAADTAAAAAPGIDIKQLMLDVVAEKTGYPVEMLDTAMDLENDLGIDSIKRVEILSATTDQVADLPPFEASEMASLRTLAGVINYIESRSGQASSSSAHANAAAAEPSGAVAIAADADQPVYRYEVHLNQVGAPGLTSEQWLQVDRVTITPADSAVAQSLATILAGRGIDAQLRDTPNADDRHVISLEGLTAFADVDQAIAVNEKVFAHACRIASAQESQGGVFIVVQDTGGDFGRSGEQIDRAWSGGLSGLAKTAAQEWPAALVRSIDLASADRAAGELAEALLDELDNGAAQLEVGLRADGIRLVPVAVAAETVPGDLALDDNAVVLVSGGARGVTAAAITALCHKHRCRIALLGRTELADGDAFPGIEGEAALMQAVLERSKAEGQALKPPALKSAVSGIQAQREIRATLQDIQNTGSQAIYLACDVGSASSVQGAVDQVRQHWDAPRGLVHGAGVLADKMLSAKTPEQFQRVFNTKVQGLRNLLAATRQDNLQTICMFSSVAARSGNAGQSDYAMANEVLNRVATSLDASSPVRVLSLNWGPWESGMVNAALKQKFAERGIGLIPLKAGAECFVAELENSRHDAVEVVLGGAQLNRPLSQADGSFSHRFSVLVDPSTLPHLDSHRVRGKVVLPVVQVVDWFANAVNSLMPSQQDLVISKLNVLRGVTLEGDVPQRLTVLVDESSKPGIFELSLLDQDGAKRYQASIKLSERQDRASQPELGVRADFGPDFDPYEQRLFHGPLFASLKQVEGLDAEGATARLVGGRALTWEEQTGWHIDQALLDGALQLALVWGYEQIGHDTLPMSFSEMRIGHRGLLDKPARCVLRGKRNNASGTQSDLWIYDDDDKFIASITGLEMFAVAESLV